MAGSQNGLHRVDQQCPGAGTAVTETRDLLIGQGGNMLLVPRVELRVGNIQSDKKRMEIQDFEAGAVEVRGVAIEIPVEAEAPMYVIFEKHRESMQSARKLHWPQVPLKMTADVAVDCQSMFPKRRSDLCAVEITMVANGDRLRDQAQIVVDYGIEARALTGVGKKVRMDSELRPTFPEGLARRRTFVGEKERRFHQISIGDSKKELDAAFGRPVQVGSEYEIHRGTN